LSLDFVVHQVTDKLIDEIRAISAKTGAVLSVHAPFNDLNIGSPNDPIREASRRETERALDVAISVGARTMNVHPAVKSFYPERFWPLIRERQRGVFAGLCDRAAKHDIVVTVENLPTMPHHLPDTADLSGQFALFDQLDHPAFGLCLDTGHAHQAGIEPAVALEMIVQHDARRVTASGHRCSLRHLHLHDNHSRGIDEHLPIGDGTIDWDRFVRTLDTMPYEGVVVLENRPMEARLRSLEAWRALAARSHS
jgi:sugar phosphate isomerase/epimerase